MSQDKPEFTSKIPLLYRLRARMQVYLANRLVRSSFQGKEFSMPIFGGVFIFLALATVISGAWFFQNYRITITRINLEERKPEILQTPPSMPPSIAEVKTPPEKTTAIAENEEVKEIKEEAKPPAQPAQSEAGSAQQAVEKSETVPAPPPVPQAVEAVEKKPAEQPGYMKTKADFVNVRKDSFLESEIIARLDAKYVVRILDRDGDWMKVDAGNGLTGWIYIDLLEGADEEEYQSWISNPRMASAKHVIKHELAAEAIDLTAEREKVKEILGAWKKAWEAKDIARYISFYSPSFATSEHTLERYKAYKDSIFKKTGSISVEISDVSVKSSNHVLVASFTQKYQSNTVNSTIRKVMHFQQERAEWKILKEAVASEGGTP
ncbi:MAG: nuclear transport factor 2 family protein [Nitrospinae bacterium]|nr:nuclear transport factor 2 family protein [Nitrospinota bacterium]